MTLYCSRSRSLALLPYLQRSRPFDRTDPHPVCSDALTYILYLGVFSTMIALLLQTVCQKYVPASKASLILSLESVFGCICGIIFSARSTL